MIPLIVCLLFGFIGFTLAGVFGGACGLVVGVIFCITIENAE